MLNSAGIMVEIDNNKQARIEQLFLVGAHYGYTRNRRHPSMTPFIFGTKNRVEIFDLEQVSELLDKAKEYVYKLGQEKKIILFASSKHEARDTIKNAALSLDMPYVAGRWIGGTLTNFSQIKKRTDRLQELCEGRDKGTFEKYTKREQLEFDREIVDLEAYFLGIVNMKELPTALFVVDTRHEKVAIAEARKMSIPVIALLNSDCNLDDAAYPIVANDAALASISFFVNDVVAAYKDGLAHPKEETKAETEVEEKGKEEAR